LDLKSKDSMKVKNKNGRTVIKLIFKKRGVDDFRTGLDLSGF